MKKICLTLCAIALGAFAANAQNPQNLTQAQIDTISTNAEMVAKDAYVEFPYSKVMFATKKELAAQKFKYNDYYNQMQLQHTNTLIAILGVMSDIYTPATSDYRIVVQYGANDMISSVTVTFFDKDIYEHILMFASDKDCDVKEITNGTGKTYKFNYGGYNFSLNYETVVQEVANTSTSSTTNNSPSNTKSKTYSYSRTDSHQITYDQFVYTIDTGTEAQSEYLQKQASKAAKRALKGKKSKSSANFY